MSGEADGRIVSSGTIGVAMSGDVYRQGHYVAFQGKDDRKAAFFAAGSIALGIAGVGAMLLSLAADKNGDADRAVWTAVAGVGATCLILLLITVPWLITRRTYMKNQNARIAEQLKTQQELRHEALEKLKKTTELATLMELNQGQIDTYHRIVTEQADKSFKSSRVAMHIGLLLLVCAAFAVAFVPLDQVRWFIGALAAFSTVLSGYLTKTYLSMYKESIGQLNRYFDQPVLNSFYLTAERLTAGLDADHAQDVRCQIINEVLATSSHRGRSSAERKDPKPKAAPKQRPPKQRTNSMNGTSQP
ncbi:hypothetical protein ACWEBX_16945 [Streptomyces sp. NPDC005070]